MKPIIIHGAWAVLAAGAYLAGLSQSVPPPATETQTMGGVRTAKAGMSGARPAGDTGGVAKRPAMAEETAWLEQWRGGDGRITPERMKEAVVAALGEADPVKSLLSFTLLLKDLTTENAPAVLQAVTEQAGGRESARFLNLLAYAWGGKDGAAALTALQGVPRRDGEVARATAMAAWAAVNPVEAKAWLAAAHKSEGAKPPDGILERGLVAGLARRDLPEALQFVLTQGEGLQGNLAGVLVEQKLKEGMKAGAEWAGNLPTERMRVTGMEVAGEQYLRRDLEGAKQWAEKIAGRADAHEAVADIANELANRNPQQAAEWTAQLPPGASQNHAFEDVYENWTGKDPLGASQSLTAMTPGPGRDAAIAAFSGTLARENPVDALTWAGEIGDANQRTDVQLGIARRWYGNAPGEAQAWITAHLPADLQLKAMQGKR